jgi:hypothetical protein
MITLFIDERPGMFPRIPFEDQYAGRGFSLWTDTMIFAQEA